MSKIKEKFEAMINDPDLENNPKFKESVKFCKAMDELTARIVEPCIDYANDHGDEDEGWAYTILISMARATCKMLYAFQYTGDKNGKDVYEFYHNELLPMCKELAYSESEDIVKQAMRKERDAEDEKDKGGVSFETKKEVILAIADPDMSVDDIINKFFKKEMTDEQRKMVADHITKVREECADKLQHLREHTDENGNYKA